MISPSEYRELLAAAIPEASDSETSGLNPQTLYTPFQHRRALDPNVAIVQGGRGVGKTVWFDALQDPALRQVAATRYQLPVLDRIDATPAFGARLRRDYPSQRRLQALVEHFSSEDIWTAVALNGFGVKEVVALEEWSDRVRWVGANPGAVEDGLLEVDEDAGQAGRTKLLLFDAMDRLHSNRRIADDLTNGALRLALTLRTSTRNLRAKIFIRYDMFESAGTDFADASKLTNNMVDLRWDVSSLYSLLFHLMSSTSLDLSARFRDEAEWVPGKAGSREELERTLELIATTHMGTNHRKGDTFTWIPNHLADGRGQVSPRSFLSALSHATMQTRELFSSYGKALHWDAIRHGVQHASEIRVREVGEDTPWVRDALKPLRGQQVPIDLESVIALWTEAELELTLREQLALTEQLDADDEEGFQTGPSSTEYHRLIEDLKQFGMFTTRADGRLDLPDVYRIAFGVGRKGGVPLVRS